MSSDLLVRTPAAPPADPPRVDFGLLWAGQSASLLGDQVAAFALPLLAVGALHVPVAQAALLRFALFVPFLVLGLPAGAIVDRVRRRRVMLLSDVARLCCYGLVAALAVTGGLTFAGLFAVAVAAGCATVFFQVAYSSYLPTLESDPVRLRRGNARLYFSESTALAAGPALGGRIVGWFGPVGGVVAHVGALLASVVTLAAIRHPDTAPPAGPRGRGWLRREISAGLRFVLGHPLLEPVLWCGGVYVLFTSMVQATLVLYGRYQLGLSATAVGLVVGAAALGYPLGNLLSHRLAGRIGDPRALALTAVVSVTGLALMPVAGGLRSVPGLVAASILHGTGEGMFGVISLTLRQTAAPPELLGRTNAAFKFVVWGAVPLGSALAAGVIAVSGLPAALWIGGLGSSLCVPALVRRGIRTEVFA
ncbi:MAG: MFS transporter [Mycobacteriales bacterium]